MLGYGESFKEALTILAISAIAIIYILSLMALGFAIAYAINASIDWLAASGII